MHFSISLILEKPVRSQTESLLTLRSSILDVLCFRYLKPPPLFYYNQLLPRLYYMVQILNLIKVINQEIAKRWNQARNQSAFAGVANSTLL